MCASLWWWLCDYVWRAEPPHYNVLTFHVIKSDAGNRQKRLRSFRRRRAQPKRWRRDVDNDELLLLLLLFLLPPSVCLGRAVMVPLKVFWLFSLISFSVQVVKLVLVGCAICDSDSAVAFYIYVWEFNFSPDSWTRLHSHNPRRGQLMPMEADS